MAIDINGRQATTCPACGNVDWFMAIGPAAILMCSSCKANYPWIRKDLQAMLQTSLGDRCNSAGPSDSAPVPLKRSQQILELLDQTTALQRKCAGISYGLSDNNHYFDMAVVGVSTRTPDSEKLADKASATFASLQSTLFNLFTLVKIAEDNLMLNLKELDSNIGGPTRTP